MGEIQNRNVVRQVRFRKMLSVFSGVGLGLGLAAIGFFNDNPGLLLAGFSARAFQLAVCAVMVGLGAAMVLLWRCPACKTFLGLVRLPLQCPHCGAVLRNRELRR